jgi:hypothetical protein
MLGNHAGDAGGGKIIDGLSGLRDRSSGNDEQ